MKKFLVLILAGACALCLAFALAGCSNSENNETGGQDIGEHEHIFGKWIAEEPSSCTEKGVKGHYTCSVCGKYFAENKETEIYDIIIPEHNQVHFDEKAATCTEKGLQAHYYCANCQTYFDGAKQETTLEDLKIDIDPNAHNYGKNDKCDYCGKDRYIVLGKYPQSEVKDESLKTALGSEAGEPPAAENANGWTSYNYYISGKIQNYMWYKDVSYLGDRYRGVYFTSYRPYKTNFTSSAKNSYQDDNGYEINTLYWFKFEPVKWEWRITMDGDELLYSAAILDGIQFDGSGTRCNYMASEVRTWLTEVFYAETFDDADSEKILLTQVENGSSSTHVQNNPNACPDTSDKIFLPSYKEMTDTYCKFDAYAADDQARQLIATDYAMAQGLFVNVNYDCGQWWLRTPSDGQELALSVFGCGEIYFRTEITRVCGIVPALRIKQ